MLSDFDEDTTEILMPIRSSGFMQMTSSQWVAWLPCPEATVRRCLVRLQRLLIARGDAFETIDDRTLLLSADPAVRVVLLERSAGASDLSGVG